MFSQRTQWSFAPNAITCLKDSLLRQGEKILDLTESNPTSCGFSYFEKVIQALDDPRNAGYEPSPQGLLRARETVCEYYHKRKIKLDPDRIFLTSSTSEGYSFLFRLLANADDGILSPRPSYPLFEFLAGLHDVRLKTYPLRHVRNWAVDFNKIQDQMKSSIKAVIVVNPNNPTGSYIKSEEVRRFAALSHKFGVPLISDEVFHDFNFTDEAFPTLADSRDFPAFTLSGLSKSLGLPQMKVSWIALSGPEKTIAAARERLEIIADTFLSVNTPSQNALEQWFKLQPRIHEEVSKRIQTNRQRLVDSLEGHSDWQCLNTEGGWYAVLKSLEPRDEEALVLRLLDKEKVFVHPGYFFDFEESGYLVLSLLPRTEIFEKGVNRMLSFLSRKNN